MIQHVRLKWFITIVVLALPAAAAQAAISIDMVPVRNPGNADDIHGDGYGGVSYAYNIGKYEVTAGQYTEFLNGVAATDTFGLYNTLMWSSTYGSKIERSGSSGSYSYSVAPDWANRPVSQVSFWDAARFANWLHNGQGSGDTESGAYINIGAHENSESPYGTFDQGGNVWEWTETAIGVAYRGLRGGSFGGYDLGLHASYRYPQSPALKDGSVGFRVASSAVVPEPGSVLVWAGLAVMGLIWFRRRK